MLRRLTQMQLNPSAHHIFSLAQFVARPHKTKPARKYSLWPCLFSLWRLLRFSGAHRPDRSMRTIVRGGALTNTIAAADRRRTVAVTIHDVRLSFILPSRFSRDGHWSQGAYGARKETGRAVGPLSFTVRISLPIISRRTGNDIPTSLR